MNIKELINFGIDYLSSNTSNFNNANANDNDTSKKKNFRFDAEILLSYVLQVDRAFLHTWPEKMIDLKEEKFYKQLIEKRKKGIPIAYLVGKKEFWSLELEVNNNVLVPRPETELLVESVLSKIPNDKEVNVLDLGTGSGAIALAIASDRSNAVVYALERSEQALLVAKKNRDRLSLRNIKFFLSDWFSFFKKNDKKDIDVKFDFILSNPPYVSFSDNTIDFESLQHEPKEALFSEDEGLKDLKYIIKESKNYLKEEGFIFLEHGHDQSQALKQILYDEGYKNIKVIKDYNQIDRIIFANT